MIRCIGVGAALYMYDVVVKSSRLLSHVLKFNCLVLPKLI